jgi:hypothetical protein
MSGKNTDRSQTTLTAEQQRIVGLVIERAEQACRYALKHQRFEADNPEYRSGWEVAAATCEGAIRQHVMAHIAADLQERSDV